MQRSKKSDFQIKSSQMIQPLQFMVHALKDNCWGGFLIPFAFAHAPLATHTRKHSGYYEVIKNIARSRFTVKHNSESNYITHPPGGFKSLRNRFIFVVCWPNQNSGHLSCKTSNKSKRFGKSTCHDLHFFDLVKLLKRN